MQKVIIDYLVKVTTDAKAGAQGFASLATEAKAAGSAFATVGAAFAAAGAAAVALANDVTGTVDRINTLAANSGLAAETIQGLEAVAKASGKELGTLLPKDLPKRISEAAEGSGEAVKGFRDLGIEVKDASGQLKSADVILKEVITALEGVEDPTLKAAAAQRVFGSEAQQLTSALADTGDLAAWVRFTQEYGADVGPEAAAATAEWNRATAMLSVSMEGLKSSAIPVVNQLTTIVDGFGQIAAMASGGIANLIEKIEEFGAVALIPSIALGNFMKGAQEAGEEYAEAYTALRLAIESGEQDAADLPVFGPSMDDMGPAKGKKGPSASDIAKANKEALRQMQLEALRFGPGDDRTTLLATQQIADATGDGLDELAQIMEEKLAQMVAYADEQTALAALGTDYQRQTLESFATEASGVFGMIQDLANLPNVIGSTLGTLADTIATLPEAILSIPTNVTAIVEGISKLPAALIESAPQLALAILDAMTRIAFLNVTIIGDTLALLFDALPGKIAEAIANVLKDLGGQLNPFDGDGQFLGGIAEKARDAIPFFETGGDVTRTGLAVVHEGERVLTAEERQSLMGGGARGPVSVSVATPDPNAAARAVARALGPYGSRIRLA